MVNTIFAHDEAPTVVHQLSYASILERPAVREKLLAARFISQEPSLSGYFREAVGECEALYREGDRFARIDVAEMGAGKKAVERLMWLKHRERNGPPQEKKADPYLLRAEDETPEQRQRSLRRFTWGNYQWQAGNLRSLLLKVPRETAEFLRLRPDDLTRFGEAYQNEPPEDWQPEIVLRVSRALTELQRMSQSQLDAIPQIMARRRAVAEEERKEAMLASLEQAIAALELRVAALEKE